jgi:hypothetical protein
MKCLPSVRISLAICLCLTVALAVALVSCSDDNNNPVQPGPTTGSVAFTFDHSVDGTPLVLGQSNGYPYTNAAGNQYNVTDLQYYTCNFRVHRADGTSYGSDAVHFRNAADPATRTFTLDAVPAGTYTAVSFTFGIDARRNYNGALLPDHDEITWPDPLGGGYHYFMMNGFWDHASGGDTQTAIHVHTGRRYITLSPGDTGYPAAAVPDGPDPIPYHHNFEVYLTLASPITLQGGQTWTVPLDVNINGWFADPVFDFGFWFPDSTPMSSIMPKLPAQDLLLQNGIAGSVCSAGTPTM